MLKKIFLFLLFILLSPSVLNAQIIISEIMYDLAEGSDSGREWVEVFNNGNDSVDLTNWKFNDGSNHNLNEPPKNGGQGSLVINPGEYIIFSGSADIFLSEQSGFLGTVIDTVMSLNNTSGTISLVNGEVIDSVNYNKELGANGDGNSLQLINGSWVAKNPTLGRENESSNQTEPTIDGLVIGAPSAGGSSFEVEEILMQKNIVANAGGDRNVVAGAEVIFEGTALGIEREPLKNARYRWSFGDGGTKEGMSVLHNYQYPGDYVVVMSVSSGEYTSSDRVIIKALPADIIISFVDDENGFIELFNKSGYELDLSWWKIKSGDNYFSFPQNTIILANKKLILPSKITGLNILDIKQTFLLYPNGEIVNQYNFVNGYNSGYIEPTISVVKSNPIYIQESKIEPEPEPEIEYQIASVNEAVKEKIEKDFFNKWTFSLGGIILFSIGSVLLASKFNDGVDEADEDQLKPEDFKII